MSRFHVETVKEPSGRKVQWVKFNVMSPTYGPREYDRSGFKPNYNEREMVRIFQELDKLHMELFPSDTDYQPLYQAQNPNKDKERKKEEDGSFFGRKFSLGKDKSKDGPSGAKADVNTKDLADRTANLTIPGSPHAGEHLGHHTPHHEHAPHQAAHPPRSPLTSPRPSASPQPASSPRVSSKVAHAAHQITSTTDTFQKKEAEKKRIGVKHLFRSVVSVTDTFGRRAQQPATATDARTTFSNGPQPQ